MKSKFLQILFICLCATACQTHSYHRKEYIAQGNATTIDQKENKEEELAKKEHIQVEAEKEKKESLIRQKGRKLTGLDLDSIEANIDLGIRLQKEVVELEKKGLTIKAKKKQDEADKTWRELIDNKLKVGKSISGNAECPFDRKSIETEGNDFSNRIFRLSCFDRRLIKEKNQQDDTINENFYLDMLFEFKAPADSDKNWPSWAQTSNDTAEIFESSSSFIGSIQIVGNWEITTFNLLKKEVKRKMEAVEIQENFLSSNRVLVKVKVKIISLQSLN